MWSFSYSTRGRLHTDSGVTRIALAIALAASVTASVAIYGFQTATINSISSELVDKSFEVDQQKQTIDEYASLLATQQQDLADKDAQLDKIRSEIEGLAQRIESQEKLAAEKSAQAEQLQLQLEQWQSQAARLEQEIGILQSEIQAKDEDLADLILENASSRRVHVTYYGLGVDEKGDGVVFPIEVEIIGAGGGRISVDVGNVDYQTGFQEAVRTAVSVAAKFTNVPVSDKDIIVRLVNTGSGLITVDGPSAGAAMTVMMIAGLTEKQPDSSVLVTGTIRSDGTIGRIGGIASKADAAYEYGAAKLVVPRAQQFQDSRIEVVGVSNVDELVRHTIPDMGAS